MINFTKFLGSGMKCDTYDPDSTKAGNEIFHYFTTTLNTLCKPFPILFFDISAIFTHFAISSFGHVFSIWHILHSYLYAHVFRPECTQECFYFCISHHSCLLQMTRQLNPKLIHLLLNSIKKTLFKLCENYNVASLFVR